MNNSKNLIHKLSSIPNTPGVYFFKNKDGKIIYIGKASKLKRRVNSYFQKTHNDYKTPLLVENIANVEWLELSSEVEALFMEAELIKRYKPLYNVRERDDKNFIFIRVGLQEDFPTVSIVRRPIDDKARYFGPFVQSYGVKQSLRYLRKIFPYFIKSDCKYSSKLEYQIGILPRPDINKSEYRKQIRKLVLVLEGRSTKLIRDLEKQIAKLSKIRRYEEAALLRDQYLALKSLNNRVVFGSEEQIDLTIDEALNKLSNLLGLDIIPRRIECYDISNFAGSDSVASMIVFSNGVPDSKNYRHFKIKTKGPNDFAMIAEIIRRRFSSRNNSWPKPDLIIVDGGKGQLNSARKVLMELTIRIPIIGLAKKFETIFQHIDDATEINRNSRVDGNFLKWNFEADSPVLYLIQRIRDEAHRFAVSYHVGLRARRIKKSFLESIPGIGPVTAKKLIRCFGSSRAVQLAPKSELIKCIGESKATLLINHISSGKNN